MAAHGSVPVKPASSRCWHWVAAWTSAAVHAVTVSIAALGSQGSASGGGVVVWTAVGASVAETSMPDVALVALVMFVAFCAAAECAHRSTTQTTAQKERMQTGLLYSWCEYRLAGWARILSGQGLRHARSADGGRSRRGASTGAWLNRRSYFVSARTNKRHHQQRAARAE